MTEKQICKRLGITPAGLKVLVKAVANEGEAAGDGFGHGVAGARTKLLRDGLIVPSDRIYKSRPYRTYTITLAGRTKVDTARFLGW